MDLIKLQGTRLLTTIGVYEWEQQKPQPIIINLILGINTTQEAFKNDNLEGTIDYARIVGDLKSWLAGYRCKLIEYLAEQIAERLFSLYPVIWVQVEVSKPGILPEVDMVSICIERHRAS